MESNGPQSGTIRDVHFRTAQAPRTEPRAGIGWLIALILLIAVAVGVYWIWFRPKAATDGTAQGQGRGGAGREVPVVASRVGGLPEVVDDGETGFLSAVGDVDKMAADAARLLRDKKLRREMGKRARASAISRYSTDLVIPKYIEFYEKVITV